MENTEQPKPRPQLNPSIDYARLYGIAVASLEAVTLYARGLEEYANYLEIELKKANGHLKDV